MDDQALSEQFQGELDQLEWHSGATPQPDDLDLARMARHALNYLRGNPDPARDYECKFELGPLGIPFHVPISVPPNQYGYDPISLGDTDCRMDWQYAHMREMAGEAEADPVELGVRRRVMSYLRDDGLAWLNPAAWTGAPIEGEWASKWTSTNLMYSLVDTYARTGDERAGEQARSIFLALKGLATWDGDRAYYEGGPVPVKDGQYLKEGWCADHSRNYPFIVEPCVHYGTICGDAEAIDFAVAMQEGFMADLQVPAQEEMRIDPETGAFSGHTHLHTRTLWGAAHLGALLGEDRYLDWAQQGYEFLRRHGMDNGWYPEHVPQGRYRAETCTVGDMASLAVHLAVRHPHYFDHLERSVRNYLKQTQFFLTPEFVALFERLHAEKGAAVVEQALQDLRSIEGGFVAAPAPDDWVEADHSVGATGRSHCGIDMMGCCPPEGMRALWEAWRNTVQEKDGAVWVNLSLTRDDPAAQVTSYAPESGRLDILARRSGRCMLRPPAWARRDVQLLRGGQPEPLVWAGPEQAYVQCDAVAPGQSLVLTWAVPTFRQRQRMLSVPGGDLEMTLHWQGNVVTGVTPRGRYLPMAPAR